MNEITPQQITEIATRLYRELPGASSGPNPGVGPGVASGAAFGEYTRLSGDVPPGVISDAIPSPSLTGLVHRPSEIAISPPVGLANALAPADALIGPGGTESPQASNAEVKAAGLRAFVDKIRFARFDHEKRPCDEGLADDPLRRLLARSAESVSGQRPLDVADVRKDFPALHQEVHGKPLAWLDNAATTQKPQRVIDALANFYAHDNSNIHRGAHTLAARATDAFEQARQKVQRFLGASSEKEIVFVRGSTEAINLVAQTYGRRFLQPGDEIVLSTLEHHANIVPWQLVARERGAVIRVIPVTDRGEVMLEEYQALLGPKTKIVAITHASNSLGTILPVAEMTQMAKRYNARVLVDGAQSVSHIPVDVQQIGCDFFVFSGHKIFGPTGIGVLFAKEELLEIMPPWQGGGNMIRNVTFEETTFANAPAKFEAGTPNIADAVGLGAALDYVSGFGLPNIAKYEHELLAYATVQLAKIPGLTLIGSAREKVGVLSLILKDRPTEEVGRLLDLEGIAVRAGHHCAQPSLRRFGLEATVRPSLCFYNTAEEIDRLADALRRILRA